MRQVFDAVVGVAYDSLIGNMQVGDILIDNTNGKVYKFVQYQVGSGAVAGVAGNACYYSSAGYLAGQVTSDSSDSNNIVAGVLTCAMTNNQYGWIQVDGLVTLAQAFTGPPAAGNSLKISATDGALAVAAAATDSICGSCLHVANKQALLNCPW